MKIFADIQKVDDELKLVYGYASTEALDSQREIVKREAIEAALPAYMKFANVREMHSSSAVGIAQDAQIDDKGLYITAKVVDSRAWDKVKAGVYKGFSIGGRATARDPDKRHIITGMDLTEISLVDRPANPEAVFDFYKVDDGDTTDEVPLDAPADIAAVVPDADAESIAQALTNEENASTEKREGEAKELPGHFDAMEDGSFPIRNETELQNAIKAIGRAKDQAAAKAHIKARAKELDMKSLIPDTRKAEAAGDVEKGMYEVAGFAGLLAQLKNIQVRSATEEASERDSTSTLPNDLQAWLASGVTLLSQMATEEGAELVNDAPAMILMADKTGDVSKRGARLNATDQEHMNAAHDSLVMAGAKCPGMGSEKADLSTEIAKATDTLSKRNDDLASENDILKAERDVLDAENTGLLAKVDSLKAEVEALKLLPADDGKAPVLKAIDKGEDVTGADVTKAARALSPNDDKWFGFNPNGAKPASLHH